MKQRQQDKYQKQDYNEQSNGDETEQRIQHRAFELYSARGQEPGHELDDWLQAEREVRDLRVGGQSHTRA